jgi:GxxExxY protein
MGGMSYKFSELTHKIIGSAMAVHREIGPGFQEKIYHQAMLRELHEVGCAFESEKEFKVIFRGVCVGIFRVDLCVENVIIVELKAVQGNMQPLFQTQIISYLKASGLEVGLLINFGNQSLDVKRLARYNQSTY